MKIAYRPYCPPGKTAMAVEWEEVFIFGRRDKPATTLIHAKQHVEDDMRVYDTDNSGEEDEYIAVKLDDDSYRYFKVHHEWYWANWGTSDRHVANEFRWEEVSAEEAAIPKDRDWMDLRQRIYPENLNWPRKEL